MHLDTDIGFPMWYP